MNEINMYPSNFKILINEKELDALEVRIDIIEGKNRLTIIQIKTKEEEIHDSSFFNEGKIIGLKEEEVNE